MPARDEKGRFVRADDKPVLHRQVPEPYEMEAFKPKPSLIARILCRIGFHSWGAEEHDKRGFSLRTCQTCGRTSHRFWGV